MRLIDLSSEPALDSVTTLLREVTSASSSVDAVARFAASYREDRGIDSYVGILPEPEKPGSYRVLFTLSSNGEASGVPAGAVPRSPEALARLPVHSGGLIGRLIERPAPRIFTDLDLTSEPLLRDVPSDVVTCIAIPLFAGDIVDSWALLFTRTPAAEYTVEHVAKVLMTGNLLALSNRHLNSFAMISQLNERLRDQFDQVARVQQQLLPSRTPDIPGLEIATSYIPSELAGGDYYDFFRLPQEHWGVLIADVSGHGAAAATIMAMLHAILHAYAPISEGEGPPNPADVLEFANARLVDANLEGAFVTGIFGVFDPVAGSFTFANAGHPPPRLKSGLDGSIRAMDSEASVPLGVMRPLGCRPHAVTLRPSDTIVLYTDGITEAFDITGDMFGTDRLDAALHGCTGQPDCVVDSVHKALFEHRGGPTRDDDQTLVAMRFHGLCRV
ncbi:Phosphoserine phosphatase RsbU [Phycisphaerales bacterium]|nr:Phosphoserine phosphatase RsbU [Phycisphaerales bacterium]